MNHIDEFIIANCTGYSFTGLCSLIRNKKALKSLTLKFDDQFTNVQLVDMFSVPNNITNLVLMGMSTLTITTVTIIILNNPQIVSLIAQNCDKLSRYRAYFDLVRSMFERSGRKVTIVVNN